MDREYSIISFPPIFYALYRDDILFFSEEYHSPRSVPSISHIRDKTGKNVTTKIGQK